MNVHQKQFHDQHYIRNKSLTINAWLKQKGEVYVWVASSSCGDDYSAQIHPFRCQLHRFAYINHIKIGPAVDTQTHRPTLDTSWDFFQFSPKVYHGPRRLSFSAYERLGGYQFDTLLQRKREGRGGGCQDWVGWVAFHSTQETFHDS